jgi:hypothetical protein
VRVVALSYDVDTPPHVRPAPALADVRRSSLLRPGARSVVLTVPSFQITCRSYEQQMIWKVVEPPWPCSSASGDPA